MSQEQDPHKLESYTTMVSDSFTKTDEHCDFELPFRRWLVRELELKRISKSEAIERFKLNPNSGKSLLSLWCKKYASKLPLPLPEMTEQEKQDIKLLQARNKTLEKQLENAKMKNIALNLLIDVAEEKLKVPIRKKLGAKQ